MLKGERQGKKYRVRRKYSTKKNIFKGRKMKEQNTEDLQPEDDRLRPGRPTPKICAAEEINIGENEPMNVDLITVRSLHP